MMRDAFFIVMPSVNMPSVIMSNVSMPSVSVPIVIAPTEVVALSSKLKIPVSC